MKSIFIFTLFVFAAVPSCNDDESLIVRDPESRYQIQNDSGTELYLLTENGFLEITGASITVIGSQYNSASSERIAPSETIIFNAIKLYVKIDDDYLLRYDQEPIDDSLWNLEISSVDGYELFEYTLPINDNWID